MKSPQIAHLPAEEQALFSELKVLKSAAGFFVGSSYNNPAGFQEPGSRDTEYFQTREQAERRLTLINTVKNPQEYLRDHG
jgi:hypothetical protein